MSLIVSLSLSLSLSCRYKRAFLLSRDEIRIEIQLFLMENKSSLLENIIGYQCLPQQLHMLDVLKPGSLWFSGLQSVRLGSKT